MTRTFLCLTLALPLAAHATPPATEASSPEDAEAAAVEASSPQDEGSAVAEDPGQPPPTPVDVDVLDPGRGRLRKLRVEGEAGDRWRLVLQRGATLSTAVGDAAPRTTAVPHALEEIEVVLDEDAITATVVDVDLLGAAPEGAAAARAALPRLAHHPLVAPRDSRQRFLPRLETDLLDLSGETSLDALGMELISEAGWALDVTAVPLPERAVGRDARWTWSILAYEQGVELEQTFTATLVKQRGRRVFLSLAVTGRAPEGARVGELVVDGFTLEGSGEVELDLRRPLAHRATLDLASSITGRIVPEEGEATTLEATTTSRLVLAPRGG